MAIYIDSTFSSCLRRQARIFLAIPEAELRNADQKLLEAILKEKKKLAFQEQAKGIRSLANKKESFL
jgi:hypothetical protein